MSLGCVYDNGLCERLSQRTKLNRLNERDLNLPVSVAHNFIPGLDLNVVVLDKYGYIANATKIIQDLLDAGLRRIYLDVFWNPDAKNWHLCPQPPKSAYNSTVGNFSATRLEPSALSTQKLMFGHMSDGAADNKETVSNGNRTVSSAECDYKFDFEAFVVALKDYILLSDTNIAASLIYLHLRPKIWDRSSPSNNQTTATWIGQNSLNSTLSSLIGNRVLTPGSLRNDAVGKGSEGHNVDEASIEKWPSLRTVLYTNTARLVVSYNSSLEDEIPELATLSTIAFPFTPTISDPEGHSVEDLKTSSFTDTFVYNADEWVSARRAGVSPVLANPNIDVYGRELINLLEAHKYWAWAPNQPILYSTNEREQMLSDGYSSSAQLAACAVFSNDGIKVANCNSHFLVLCRNKSDAMDWIITQDNHTYFDPSCPKMYEFATPSTPLEARILREKYYNNTAQAAWVDFNSLYLPNCWVTGGTNAICPYNIRQDGRNGIGFIAVAAAISFCALVFIFLFEWDRSKSPLMRKNRKADKSKQPEFEGILS